MLVTAGADQLLPTIRSRCQRVDFAYLGADDDRAALLAERRRARARRPRRRGSPAGASTAPRALDGRLGAVRDAFVAAAAALDGTGARWRRTSQLGAGGDAGRADRARGRAGRGGRRAHAELEAAGLPRRIARTQLRRLEEQHKRAHRHARTELLLEGITALETVYRDALAGPGAPTLNVDRPLLVARRRAPCGAALDACRAARQALVEFNPNETLLLERLLLHLPAAG